MLSFKASAQVTCCPFTSCIPSYPEDPWIICGPYDDLPGPYHVRVYLYFIVTGDPGDYDEDLKDRAERIWANLKADFDKHQIFFIPGFGDCRDVATTYYAIESVMTANDILDLREEDVDYSRDGGLCIYVFPDNLTANTASGCIPSSFCYLQGVTNISQGPDSKSKVVSHEVGHCLGLMHTFHGDDDGNFGDGCPDEDGSNCWEEGDYVCDTPPDDGSYPYDATCSPGSPSIDTILYSNLMSYFTPAECRYRFTAGQGARMRHYLGNNIGLVAQVKAETRISTTVNWNTARYATGNIIVETGGTLTINAPVYMPEGSYIYVERGGALSVRNLVTGACDKMWQGIIVDGDDTDEQVIADQGVVYVTATGIIEHARCGVRLQGWYDEGQYHANRTGGMLKASLYATFRDNTIGLQFDKYSKMSASYLQGCTFTVTDDYRGDPDDKITHVRIRGLYGPRIGGDFLDERTDEFADPASRATGIDADDGAFSIRPNFSAAHFEGLYDGIRMTQISDDSDVGGSHIEGASFEKCFTGIYANRYYNFYIGGNTFELLRPDGYTGDEGETLTGILLDGDAQEFMLTENTFTNPLGSELEDFLVGTEAVALGTKDTRIFKNVYDYLSVANRAADLNATAKVANGTLLYTGLWYACNTNIDIGDGQDFVVLQGGNIRHRQGSFSFNQTIAAGNIFSAGVGTFNNMGIDNQVLYHYYPFDPAQEPEMPTGLADPLIEGDENTECEDEECPPPCDTEIELTARKEEFFQMRQAWNDKLEELPTITNPAKAQLTADTINFLRARLDREGGLILMHYALDTFERQADSILVWLAHQQTYDSDLRLALHHFFAGDYEESDDLIDLIPSRYPLDEATAASFDEVQDVLATIREELEEETPVDKLPEVLLDDLETNWGTACSQAGALARSLLRRNGRDFRPDCSGAERPALNNATKLNGALSIQLYPNPANEQVTLEYPPALSNATWSLREATTGRIVWQQASIPPPITQIDVSRLPGGVYILAAVTPQGVLANHKMLIFH